jgi:hypothetical protein
MPDLCEAAGGSATMSAPLAACPFCGNDQPNIVKWEDGGEPRWRVVCLNCLHSNVFSEAEAVAAWNRVDRLFARAEAAERENAEWLESHYAITAQRDALQARVAALEAGLRDAHQVLGSLSIPRTMPGVSEFEVARNAADRAWALLAAAAPTPPEEPRT